MRARDSLTVSHTFIVVSRDPVKRKPSKHAAATTQSVWASELGQLLLHSHSMRSYSLNDLSLEQVYSVLPSWVTAVAVTASRWGG